MKKIFTLLSFTLFAMSASAITVTLDGKPVEKGSTVTVGSDAFTLVDKVPGKIYSMDAEFDFYVSGGSNLSLRATSATDNISICTLGGQCFPFNPAGDGSYAMNMNFTEGFDIKLSYSQVTEVPAEIHSTDVTITSSDGEFKFTFVFDTTSSAGVGSILTDHNGSYTVYSLLGNLVLKTTEKSEIYSLPKGIYIVNGKKIIVR